MSKSVRIFYTRHHLEGLLAGMTTETHLPYPLATAARRVAEYQEMARTKRTRKDIQGNRYWISNVRYKYEG